jgi:hypothetical protein
MTIGALVGLMIATSAASALEIAPDCKKMRDPIGCTCALQNGGTIRSQAGGNKRWVSKLHGSASTNEAFVQCQIRARGHS